MKGTQERREVFRRYADRRRALMLAIHEILFDQRPGESRDRDLLEEFRRDFFTDDAFLVEKMGIPVSVVPGSERNIKVTTPHDLALAQFLLRLEHSG